MRRVAIIGAGPAGLMAAEQLCGAGVQVDVYDAMPSAGRKFLLAGKGGLNLTHSEPDDLFASRFGARRAVVEAWLQEFGATQVRQWAQGLGVDTFVGTSGRVFPAEMKAAPLLRAWLHRLLAAGVRFHMRHRWLGWDEAGSKPGGQALLFANSRVGADAGHAAPRVDSDAAHAAPVQVQVQADAVVLALGGGSWSRLGSDGAWVRLLQARAVDVAPLLPSNCGFDVAVGSRAGWSDHFRTRFAGQPFKSVAIACDFGPGRRFRRKGEFVATATGVEGSLIYAVSSLLRDELIALPSRVGTQDCSASDPHAAVRLSGSAHAADTKAGGVGAASTAAEPGVTFALDLLPDHSADAVRREVAHPRGSRSLSSHLKGRLGLQGIKLALLHEVLPPEALHDPLRLAAAIKALPVRVTAPRPLDEAISSAGGVRFEALTDDLMISRLPGVFCAGEMLDWEAPTGGYLLTACLASGRRAGQGVLRFLGPLVG